MRSISPALALLVLALLAPGLSGTEGCDGGLDALSASVAGGGASDLFGDEGWEDEGSDSGDDDDSEAGGDEGGGAPPTGAPPTPEEQACGIVAELACGQYTTLNTATDPRATNVLFEYGDQPGHWDGPELGFRVNLPAGAEVRLVDPVPMDIDHDLFALGRSGGPCDHEDLAAVGWNSTQVEAAGLYSVIVDGYDGDAGEFTFGVDCGGGLVQEVELQPGEGPVGDCAGGGDVCVDSAPFYEAGDTNTAERRAWNSYPGCSSANEEGPEVVYEVVVPERSYLSAVIVEEPDGGDVDVHILRELDPASCVDRDDRDAGALVEAGTWYVVVDTYGGDHNAGEYELAIGVVPVPTVDCGMTSEVVERDGGFDIALPATGPVVKEGHYVTVIDGYGTSGAGPWPQSSTEGLATHAQNTEATVGFVMRRTESWTPPESSDWGQSASYAKLPPDAEAWLITMRWAGGQRPDPPRKMIVQADGRAVVTLAGYEYGPFLASQYAGVSEEVHRYLGTGHEDDMLIGFAADPALPLGPVDCE